VDTAVHEACLFDWLWCWDRKESSQQVQDKCCYFIYWHIFCWLVKLIDFHLFFKFEPSSQMWYFSYAFSLALKLMLLMGLQCIFKHATMAKASYMAFNSSWFIGRSNGKGEGKAFVIFASRLLIRFPWMVLLHQKSYFAPV
jgi:hypothetical protein